MKDHIGRIVYGAEGFVITYAGYHVWEEIVLPLVIASLGAVITVLIQHYLKKYLQKKDDQKVWKQNGRHLN